MTSLSFAEAELQYQFDPQPNVVTRLPGKIVATWFYAVPAGQEFKVKVSVSGALTPNQRQAIDSSKHVEPSVSALQAEASGSVASEVTLMLTFSDITKFYAFWSGANFDPYQLVFVFQAPSNGFHGSLSLSNPFSGASAEGVSTIPVSSVQGQSWVLNEVTLDPNEKLEFRIQVPVKTKTLTNVVADVQALNPSFVPTPFTAPSPSPSPSPSPPPLSLCVPGGVGCGILPGSMACCQGFSCQVDGFNAICKPDGVPSPSPSPSPFPSALPSPSAEPSVSPSSSPSPEPSASPSPSPSPSASPSPSPEPVGAAGYPVAVLFVHNAESLTSLESAFNADLSKDYPRVVLQSYAQASGQALSKYPVFFVIEFNDALKASVLQSLLDGGSRINLIGSASAYAAQMSLDSNPVVLPS